jgi:hypothetical protein
MKLERQKRQTMNSLVSFVGRWGLMLAKERPQESVAGRGEVVKW